MPKSYSGGLRERVIEAVEMDGASRRRFDVSASSAVKWLGAVRRSKAASERAQSSGLASGLRWSGASFEAPAVADLDNIAVMDQAT
jgi:hypothetical protein